MLQRNYKVSSDKKGLTNLKLTPKITLQIVAVIKNGVENKLL